jgi:peptidoglycan/LPS O-acetylase OafA/YrhL
MNSDVIARQSGGSFRPDVEGLRAVAVLLVVGCHCGISWCAGGFVGVDVFLVLSGYLITGLLTAEHRATSRIHLPGFYARRARRLLPAFALVLLATMLAAAVVFGPQELAFTGHAARAAGLYMSNVFFDRSASDYFAPNVEGNPLLHTWSLGLEEQFYLVWPMLILVSDRGPSRTRRSIWVLSAVTVPSFAYCVYATRVTPTVAFYELPARAWEFGVGGLLALLPASRSSAATSWAVACGIVGMGVILATGVLVKGGTGFPGWLALLPVAGTLATLFAGAKAPQRGISAVLGAAPLQFVGARSYSWYLWHWPFVVFAGALFPGVTVGGKIAAAVASLLAAILTFSFVERPIRENPYLRARSGLSLRLAAGATLLTIGASWALIFYGQQLAMDRSFQSLTAATTDIADLSQKACMSWGLSSEVKTCVFGASHSARTVVLFGDSHAVQWFNPVRTAANGEAWRLITVLRAGCPASDFDPHPISSSTSICKDWRSHAIEKIVAIRPSAVVMASYTGATIRGFRTEAPISTEDLRLGTRRTLEELEHAGVPIVVLRDTPLPPFDMLACVERRVLHQLHSAETCDFDASVARNDAAFAAERAAADGLANIKFLDLSDLICPGKSCPATQGGLLVYRDDNHLTGTFAETLAPTVRARLFHLLRKAQ